MPLFLRTLPVYYPTTTLVVDDDTLFLKTLARALLPGLPVRLFSDPVKAIGYMNQPNPVKLFTDHWGEEASERDAISISLGTIEKQLYIDARFSEITCVVADYAMPEMDGLRMIQEMDRSDICRVLFTGNVTPGGAIEAFNKQVITRYIQKSWESPLKELRGFLSKSQKDHARKRFDGLHGMFDKPAFKIFVNKEFARWFDNYLKVNNIVEYYWLASIHGFYLADFNGNGKVLLVHDKLFVDNQVLSIQEHGGSIELSRIVGANEVVAAFKTANGLYDDTVKEWRHNIFVVSKVINEDGPIFVAEVDDVRAVNINCSSMTFSDYIDYLGYANRSFFG